MSPDEAMSVRVVQRLTEWLDSHHVHRRASVLAILVTLAAALELAAGGGMAYVAGFGAVGRALTGFDWPWLGVAVGATLAAFAGYWLAYQAIFRAGDGKPLPAGPMTAVATAGFGGFLSHGTGLDRLALRAAGAARRDAQVRLWALSGLEQGVLALGGCGASIAVLASGAAVPGPSYTWPWAVAPLPGFALAFWLARRYAARLRAARGWRRHLGTFLDCVQLVRRLFARMIARDAGVLGMALFWAGEAAAMWCGLAAAGVRLPVATLVVGFATGMLVTRRSVPFGGAGLLMLVLPLALWACGAPLPAAVAGVFVYRFVTLWLPLPGALAARPSLREVCAAAEPARTAAVV